MQAPAARQYSNAKQMRCYEKTPLDIALLCAIANRTAISRVRRKTAHAIKSLAVSAVGKVNADQEASMSWTRNLVLTSPAPNGAVSIETFLGGGLLLGLRLRIVKRVYALDLAVNNVNPVENVVHTVHRFHFEESRDIISLHNMLLHLNSFNRGNDTR
jgi:hypothetical protein